MRPRDVGNNAVGAEGTASVLHLDERARVCLPALLTDMLKFACSRIASW